MAPCAPSAQTRLSLLARARRSTSILPMSMRRSAHAAVSAPDSTTSSAQSSAASGTGIIAGGGVRIVLESAGIKNVLSKSQGSSNAHNVVKATFDALLQLRDPVTVARQRGVSLDKVFNG